jgi:DtxR family Mn-dependent transcriptional regulator
LDVGQKVVIAGVDTQDAEVLRYLGELGLYPETVVKVLEMAPFDGPVTVRVNGEQHVLGHTIANKILVMAVHHSLCQVETIEEDQK